MTTPDPVVEGTWQRIEDLRDPGTAHKRTIRAAEERALGEHTRYMVTLDDLIGHLHGAGFDVVDLYFRDLEHTTCAGRSAI